MESAAGSAGMKSFCLNF